jgi:hypothetical protein
MEGLLLSLITAVALQGAAWARFAPEVSGAARPALVALIQHKGGDAGKRSVMDRLAAVMIRNATRGKYSSTKILIEESATREAFLGELGGLARTGHDVDVIVMVPGSDEAIALDSGAIRADDLRGVTGTERDSLRFVYSASGCGLAQAWREAGARTVLCHIESAAAPTFTGALAPLFFPRFIAAWGKGSSALEAAEMAGAISTRVAAGLGEFASDDTLVANGGVLAEAPRLMGDDIDVAGRARGEPRPLAAVSWPKERAPRYLIPHNPLSSALLGLISRAVAPDLDLRPELMPRLDSVLNATGDELWDTLQALFPGASTSEILMPGRDVRVILEKVIPDFNKYMAVLVDHLDTFAVTRENGHMALDVRLLDGGMNFSLKPKKSAKTGQPYAVDLEQNMHADISMRRDSIVINDIAGITVQVKIPILPDAVHPRELKLDAATEKLKITAAAVKDYIEVVGTANVRAKHFDGVDWMETLSRNFPLLLSLLVFAWP